jgi:hypothetical protein
VRKSINDYAAIGYGEEPSRVFNVADGGGGKTDEACVDEYFVMWKYIFA